MRRLLSLILLAGAPLATARAQDAAGDTHADTLRGSIGPARDWWDVTFYDLHVRISPADSSISGHVGISYRVLKPGSTMQVDLQQPMVMDSVVQQGKRLTFTRDSNAFFVAIAAAQHAGDTSTVVAYYHGKPRVAITPPWDGGYIWKADSLKHPWIATANQGLGASVWWPNKDTQADEPDSQRIAIAVPETMVDVSNGRLRSVTPNGDGTTTWEWFVTSPINNYDVAVDAGDYTHWTDIYYGERGPLTMDFWPLTYHLQVARTQFLQAQSMMKCFEHWFGPYPFYDDGYKLVEAPHLGMEHQSAIAYGNHYLEGYLGRDLSRTGLGLGWDYIIVHESAHEWWGNSITTKDIADSWVHEGFAMYAEGLYTECQEGKDAGTRYLIGTRGGIQNDAPIISRYGINEDPGGDIYAKGAQLLLTIRQVVNDDEKWRSILRGLQQTFYHQTVTSAQIEQYMNAHAGVDLTKVFDQYLRTTQIPVFEYSLSGSTLTYQWTNVVPGFAMPVRVTTTDTSYSMLRPTTAPQRTTVSLSRAAAFKVDPSFYVIAHRSGTPADTTVRGQHVAAQ